MDCIIYRCAIVIAICAKIIPSGLIIPDIRALYLKCRGQFVRSLTRLRYRATEARNNYGRIIITSLTLHHTDIIHMHRAREGCNRINVKPVLGHGPPSCHSRLAFYTRVPDTDVFFPVSIFFLCIDVS